MAIKFFINIQFSKDRGLDVCRVLAVQKKNIMGVTQLIVCCQVSSVLSLFSLSKNCAGMLSGKMHNYVWNSS